MRKIEKEMIAAVKARKDWKSGNTEVKIEGPYLLVFLHGSVIAFSTMHCVAGLFRPMNCTWDKWPTRTTASRLRALGFKYDKKSDCWN